MDEIRRAVFIHVDSLLIFTGAVSPEYYRALFGTLSDLAQKGFVGRGPTIHLCSDGTKEATEQLANLSGIVNNWQIAESGAILFNPTTGQEEVNHLIEPETKKMLGIISRRIVPRILKSYGCLSLRLGNRVAIVLEKQCHSLVDDENIVRDIEARIRKAEHRFFRRLYLSRKIRRRGPLPPDLVKKCLFRVRPGMTNGMKTISILPISANMGSAMERLAEIEGRDLSYSLAIGCSYNDSSFFGRTGLVGCPANADERCIEIVKKKKGNKVSLHNYSLAVVDLIRWLTGENAQ